MRPKEASEECSRDGFGIGNEVDKVDSQISRRKFFGIAASTGAALYLADACSSAPSNSNQKTQLTLSVADYDANMRRDTQALVDEWNSKNPDVKVNLLVTNWDVYPDRLLTWVSGNRAPDIANIDTVDFNFYRTQGKLLPLDDVISKSFLKNFYPSPLHSFNYGGHQYALPYFLDPRAMYYRSDLFAEAGLPAPVTWDDVASAAKRLTGGGIYGYTVGGKAPQVFTGFDYKLFNSGPGAPRGHRGRNGKWDINNSYGVKALTFLEDMIKSGYTNPNPTGSEMQADLQPVFISGKLAMIETGSWLVAMLQQQAPNLKYSLTNLPVQARDEKPVTLTEPDCIMVFKTDNTQNHKAAVGRFLEFQFNKTNRMKFANQRGCVPERQDVGTDPQYLDSPQKKFFSGLVPVSINRYSDMGTKGSKVDQVATTWFQKVFLGQMGVKPALDQCASALNAIDESK